MPRHATQAFLPLLAPLVAEVSDRAATPLLTPIARLPEPVLTHAAAEALRGIAGPDVACVGGAARTRLGR